MRKVGYLSPKKVRWISRNGKHRIGKFEEKEAIEITQKLEKQNPDYYYFRVVV